MGEMKCRCHLQVTRKFWVLLFIPLTLSQGQSPSHLFYKENFHNSRLSEVWCDLGSILRCLSSPGVMIRTLKLLGLTNTSTAGPDVKVSYPHPSTRSYPNSGIRVVTQTTWCVGSLESSEVPYEDSYVLSLLLLNTIFIVTKEIFLLKKN